MNTKTFKVIDGDNMRLLYTFTEQERESVTARLESDWGSVNEDKDGDIIVWEDAE